MNNSSNSGDLLASGPLGFATYSEETFTLETSMDEAYGNGGGDGWNAGAYTVDGCDGRGGSGGCLMSATSEDAWNMKYGWGE
jgi:hypothetical protein